MHGSCYHRCMPWSANTLEKAERLLGSEGRLLFDNKLVVVGCMRIIGHDACLLSLHATQRLKSIISHMLTLTFISPKEHLNSDKVLFFNRSPYSLRFFTFRV